MLVPEARLLLQTAFSPATGKRDLHGTIILLNQLHLSWAQAVPVPVHRYNAVTWHHRSIRIIGVPLLDRPGADLVDDVCQRALSQGQAHEALLFEGHGEE